MGTITCPSTSRIIMEDAKVISKTKSEGFSWNIAVKYSKSYDEL